MKRNKMSEKDWWVVAIIAVIFAFGIGATTAKAGDYRLGGMNNSQHWVTKDKGDYNETHGGVFAEFRITDDSMLGFMNYENSFYNNSNAIYYSRDLPLSDHITWGYTFGMVSGYDYIDPAPWMGILLTLCMMDCDSPGFNLKQRTIMIPGVVNAYQFYGEW